MFSGAKRGRSHQGSRHQWPLRMLFLLSASQSAGVMLVRVSRWNPPRCVYLQVLGATASRSCVIRGELGALSFQTGGPRSDAGAINRSLRCTDGVEKVDMSGGEAAACRGDLLRAARRETCRPPPLSLCDLARFSDSSGRSISTEWRFSLSMLQLQRQGTVNVYPYTPREHAVGHRSRPLQQWLASTVQSAWAVLC